MAPEGPAAGLDRWQEFIAWLGEMSRDLPLIYGKDADGEMCDRLLGELRRNQAEDAAFAAVAMGPALQQCFGGIHSLVRAVSAGYVELTPELRAELTGLVSEVGEVIMRHDLEQ